MFGKGNPTLNSFLAICLVKTLYDALGIVFQRRIEI
jgi:hypothetical protein